MTVGAAIRALGDAVERAWRHAGRDVAAFAEIAAAALAQSVLLDRIPPSALCDWLLESGAIPDQSFRDFGQPAMTLFRGHRFYIELLCWRESTTAIHQHAFAGAFAVLSGSSLHTHYRFIAEDVAAADIAFGQLPLVEAEVLPARTIRMIQPGSGLIHALFHLDHPTFSIVVRTETLARYQPQLAFYRAGVGHDTRAEPEPFSVRLRLLDALGDTDDLDFWRRMLAVAASADAWMALAILNVGYKHGAGTDGFAALVAAIRLRIGERVDILLACLAERARERRIIALRQSVRDADHRFFLALLLNLPDRMAIDRAIETRWAGSDSEDRIVAWVSALGHDGRIGTHVDLLVQKMLRYALRGLPLEAVEREVRRVWGADSDPQSLAALRQIWDDLHANPILAPLFVNPPPIRARLQAA
jgi:hypothetical protein